LARRVIIAVQRLAVAEGVDETLLPAGRQAETGDHRLEHGLVAQNDRQVCAGDELRNERAGLGQRPGIGTGFIGFPQVLDACLVEFVAAFAALAEHLAQIGVTARRGDILGNMGAAHGNGEFRPQAQAFAGLALGEEDAAAQVLSGHVEKRLGRLDHRDIDTRRLKRFEHAGEI
jgi:hypothetical protein